MTHAILHFSRGQDRTKTLRLLRGLFPWSCVLLLAGFAGSATAASDGVHAGFIAMDHTGAAFAIADFDGDHRPDMASIETGQSDRSRTDYWMQLRLTTGGQQSIRITAPVGGVQIAARDVNGDNALDLVLTTAWLQQPVAILLNDGRGNFSQVDPTAFPSGFWESASDYTFAFTHVTQTVAASPPPHASDGSEIKGSSCPSPARSLGRSSSGPPLNPGVMTRRGRAPPSEVPHS